MPRTGNPPRIANAFSGSMTRQGPPSSRSWVSTSATTASPTTVTSGPLSITYAWRRTVTIREVVDLLARVTSEILRGYGIEEIDDLLEQLSEAWMLELGKHIRGD